MTILDEAKPVTGDDRRLDVRRLVRAGYAWHVFAYFPCNAAGVRVAVRKSPVAAERFAVEFARRNNVDVSWVMR